MSDMTGTLMTEGGTMICDSVLLTNSTYNHTSGTFGTIL